MALFICSFDRCLAHPTVGLHSWDGAACAVVAVMITAHGPYGDRRHRRRHHHHQFRLLTSCQNAT